MACLRNHASTVAQVGGAAPTTSLVMQANPAGCAVGKCRKQSTEANSNSLECCAHVLTLSYLAPCQLRHKALGHKLPYAAIFGRT